MTAPSLDTSDLDYELPPELVAQHPAPDRGGSRLMVVEAGRLEPRTIARFDDAFVEQLRDDDLVVANDARVLHARVQLRRATGGSGEVLLLAPTERQPGEGGVSRWTAMARPARKFRPGDEVATVREPSVAITFVERLDPQVWEVEVPAGLDDVPTWLRAHGELPLPPYISERGQDEARYQTVHARADGSVAAPTAGLHFDEATWARVRARCEVAHVTLHVGAGTFLPVAEGPLAAHPMHAERYEVPPATDAAVRAAREAGRRVVAIGTTTTRTLEHVYRVHPDGNSHPPELTGSTQLFIVPGHRWSCVGAMLTNFHLPRSTLIALVMAFGGEDATRAWYRRAVAERMRFFSFGDAMFLHGPPVRG